jgi:hypothetical protein
VADKTTNFFDTSPDRRTTGKIVSAILPGWWMVKDSRGKKVRAASDQTWRPGDEVARVGGQIVGAAGRIQKATTYQV